MANAIRVIVVEVTVNGDLSCIADQLGRFEVDPFCGCALPELTKSERKALIGQSFEMKDYWQHESGVYLCHTFEPTKVNTICGRCYAGNVKTYPAKCKEQPEKLAGKPIGQYLCPGCGAMLIAGIHPDLCKQCLQMETS